MSYTSIEVRESATSTSPEIDEGRSFICCERNTALCLYNIICYLISRVKGKELQYFHHDEFNFCTSLFLGWSDQMLTINMRFSLFITNKMDETMNVKNSEMMYTNSHVHYINLTDIGGDSQDVVDT